MDLNKNSKKLVSDEPQGFYFPPSHHYFTLTNSSFPSPPSALLPMAQPAPLRSTSPAPTPPNPCYPLNKIPNPQDNFNPMPLYILLKGDNFVPILLLIDLCLFMLGLNHLLFNDRRLLSRGWSSFKILWLLLRKGKTVGGFVCWGEII